MPSQFIPQFRVEIDNIGIAVSVDPSTGEPIDFLPAGRANAEGSWMGRVVMTAPVEHPALIRFISEDVSLLPTPDPVTVPAGKISVTFKGAANSGPTPSSTGIVVGVFVNAIGHVSTAAVRIEVLSLS
jgi:hypothetical protein